MGDDVEALSYTDASRELDGIVQFFEQREVDVDQLVARLERATALIEELDSRLRQTRMQVEQLVPRLTAVLEAEPMAAKRPASKPDEAVRWRAGHEEADDAQELF